MQPPPLPPKGPTSALNEQLTDPPDGTRRGDWNKRRRVDCAPGRQVNPSNARTTFLRLVKDLMIDAQGEHAASRERVHV